EGDGGSVGAAVARAATAHQPYRRADHHPVSRRCSATIDCPLIELWERLIAGGHGRAVTDTTFSVDRALKLSISCQMGASTKLAMTWGKRPGRFAVPAFRL